MRDPLWSALEAQAAVWRDMEMVSAFAAALPRNSASRASGLPGQLQELAATGAWVNSRPLRAASSVQMVLEQRGPLARRDTAAELEAWLGLAWSVEVALRRNVAWLRSRLPGYPAISVPQLEPNTPLTTEEFTWRLPWLSRSGRRGLQLQPGPSLGPLLASSSAQGWTLDNSSRKVAAALRKTEEWAALDEARHLDDTALAELTAARQQMSDRLKPAVIDAHEPDLALRRDAYRQAEVAAVVEQLTGPARGYVDAFDAVDRLLEESSSDVFGQLVAYGEPQLAPRPRDLSMQGGPEPQVSFVASGGLPDVGQVMWLDDPLLPDAIWVTKVSLNLEGPTTDATVRLTGRVLNGTGQAWVRPSKV